MENVYDIIQEINLENGSNYKMSVLKKHKDNKTLQRVLKMCYDKVMFTYGLTMKNVNQDFETIQNPQYDLEYALDFLEDSLCTRLLTGNLAIEGLEFLLENLSEQDRFIVTKIINRDLRINMGRSNINKVFKNLIVKPCYMRCGTYNEKTAKKIVFPAFLQLKADGTYREFSVNNGIVEAISRAGNNYEYPKLFEKISSWPDGRYFGELTMWDHDNDCVMDRATGNGLINSDDEIEHSLIFDMWDFVTHEEYYNARNKIKCTTKYIQRFNDLTQIIMNNNTNNSFPKTHVIKTVYVDSLQRAGEVTARFMNDGFEGAIIKNKDSVFKDGTNLEQLKMKVSMELEVRITGFIEGKAGTKREKTFGSVTYQTDDELIKGSVPIMSDELLEKINSERDEWVGCIITISGNDLTKSKNNEYYAVSHPVFVERRDDRDSTDTLERAFEIRTMARNFS